MNFINKRRLFYCLIISVLINGVLFFKQFIRHNHLANHGIIKELYIKSLTGSDVTFFQKAKYTRVAKIYYVVSEGDTVYDIIKNTWAMQAPLLENIPYYLVFDSVIYDSNKPGDYQLLSEFRNYSKTYAVVSYFLVGPIIFTVWFYFLTIIFLRLKVFQDIGLNISKWLFLFGSKSGKFRPPK